LKLKKRIYIFAIVFGLLTVFAVYYYIQQVQNPVVVQEEMVTVVVANTTIPEHERITPEMLSLTSLPLVSVHPDVARSVDDVVGYTSKMEIINGEQVLVSKVATVVDEASLSYRIPENMRAIAVPMTEMSGVSGYVEKGDRVDIIVSYNDPLISLGQITVTQFQNIEIMEKGPLGDVQDGSEASGLTTSLVVLVTPAQAEVLAYAIVGGTMQMSLRNPVDTVKVNDLGFGAETFDGWKVR
jgi:pilus assembly protein CpaB